MASSEGFGIQFGGKMYCFVPEGPRKPEFYRPDDDREWMLGLTKKNRWTFVPALYERVQFAGRNFLFQVPDAGVPKSIRTANQEFR